MKINHCVVLILIWINFIYSAQVDALSQYSKKCVRNCKVAIDFYLIQDFGKSKTFIWNWLAWINNKEMTRLNGYWLS